MRALSDAPHSTPSRATPLRAQPLTRITSCTGPSSKARLPSSVLPPSLESLRLPSHDCSVHTCW